MAGRSRGRKAGKRGKGRSRSRGRGKSSRSRSRSGSRRRSSPRRMLKSKTGPRGRACRVVGLRPRSRGRCNPRNPRSASCRNKFIVMNGKRVFINKNGAVRSAKKHARRCSRSYKSRVNRRPSARGSRGKSRSGSKRRSGSKSRSRSRSGSKRRSPSRSRSGSKRRSPSRSRSGSRSRSRSRSARDYDETGFTGLRRDSGYSGVRGGMA